MKGPPKKKKKSLTRTLPLACHEHGKNSRDKMETIKIIETPMRVEPTPFGTPIGCFYP